MNPNPNSYLFQNINRGQQQPLTPVVGVVPTVIKPTVIHSNGGHGSTNLNNFVVIQPQYQQPQQQNPYQHQQQQIYQQQQQIYQQQINKPPSPNPIQQQPQPSTPFSDYLTKIFDKFNNFSNYHLGVDLSQFDKYEVPSQREFNSIALKIKQNQHIHTGLMPFILATEQYQPPNEFNKVDVIQYYLDGLLSLLVVKSLSGEKTKYDKQIPLFIVKCKSMIEKLSKYLQQQLYNSSNNCNSNSSIVLQNQQKNNPIINHFNKELDMIKNIIVYIQSHEINSETSVYFSKTLFSLLSNKGYFWTIEENNENLKLQYYDIICTDLNRLVQSNAKDNQFKYLMGCYCYSYFKICQGIHNIDSSRFISWPTQKSFDPKIYQLLKSSLEISNNNFVEAFKDPISGSYMWLIYAKTCSLLNYEDKAHIWIQYFINEAYDRVSAASFIQFDPDIAHYRTHDWFIEIMKSIEDEKKNRLIEEQKNAASIASAPITINNNNSNNNNNNNQTITYSGSPSIHGNPGVYELYQEFKENLFLNGMVFKNMNHDTQLIGSNILTDLNSLHPPLQSKEVEIAQKRLDERLELYMLKNSKEIPGDGNCQMHALSDQIYDDIGHSQEIRKTIVDWLRKNKDFQLPNGATLNQFVMSNNWDDYCDEMAKLGNWGDHLTLLAAAEIYGMKISIISSVESSSNFFIEIIPTKIKKEKVLLLSHYAEFHYGSLGLIHNP
ncbi:hypothetical protein CYY_004601 [Polysphondylium violaceum]|uniref:OTU domain-containing protein n=1 Tax=Polysphondylium violaceum TaxID=133409 RepID=A0A8J4V4Z2_9MYCE|nr:hypothetical protein CYY_004601 [Polysphondylium violaceum]